jgi:hypothetical protein
MKKDLQPVMQIGLPILGGIEVVTQIWASFSRSRNQQLHSEGRERRLSERDCGGGH